jgi:quercetin dioxygenase-like cupin family protein
MKSTKLKKSAQGNMKSITSSPMSSPRIDSAIENLPASGQLGIIKQKLFQRRRTMKKINLFEANDFSEKGMKKLLVHDSPYFKILNFNFKAGQELPVHSHDIEGQVSLVVLAGTGEFLGKDGTSMPAAPGDVVISDISEPHGLRATTDLRLLVTIAPPI